VELGREVCNWVGAWQACLLSVEKKGRAGLCTAKSKKKSGSLLATQGEGIDRCRVDGVTLEKGDRTRGLWAHFLEKGRGDPFFECFSSHKKGSPGEKSKSWGTQGKRIYEEREKTTHAENSRSGQIEAKETAGYFLCPEKQAP